LVETFDLKSMALIAIAIVIASSLSMSSIHQVIAQSSNLLALVEDNGGGFGWWWNTYGVSSPNSWGTWTQQYDNAYAPTPALCSAGSGRAELFVTGWDHGIFHITFQNGGFLQWDHDASGAVQGTPACGVLNGVIYLVAEGLDNTIWVNSHPLSSTVWNGWASMDGMALSAPALVVSTVNNRMDLVVRGQNSALYHKGFANGSWSSGWDSLGGGTFDSPGAASNSTALSVVVRGTDGSVWYKSMTFADGSWTPWTYLDGGTSSAPSIATDDVGMSHIVVRGIDNGIYHRTLSSPWESLSEGLTGEVPAIGFSGGNLVVLVRGMDNGLYSDVLSAGVWSGWTSANGATPTTPVMCQL
jgi:hypothetical protein